MKYAISLFVVLMLVLPVMADDPKAPAPGKTNGPPVAPRGPMVPPDDPDLDTDGDGDVSLQEWINFYKIADTNRDGKLDVKEWAAAFAQQLNKTRKIYKVVARKVGDAAPQVWVAKLDGSGSVDLSKPKRPTVLMFGSYT